MKFLERVVQDFNKFLSDEAGVTAIEYALIAAATSLALVATMPAYTAATNSLYTRIENYILGSQS